MVATDFYDGAKPENALKPDQKDSALKEIPSVLEFYAYTLFYGSLMIGPQFSINHYRKYLNGDFVKKSGDNFWSETRVLGIKKGLAGLIGLGLSAVLGGTYYTVSIREPCKIKNAHFCAFYFEPVKHKHPDYLIFI